MLRNCKQRKKWHEKRDIYERQNYYNCELTHSMSNRHYACAADSLKEYQTISLQRQYEKFETNNQRLE